MNPARRKLRFYGAVVALYVLVSAWWAYYFTNMGQVFVTRMERAGAALDVEQIAALENAIARTARMFLFEGAFLGLLLLASAYLVVRALEREVAVHRQQRDFLSAVTHELKSPIASASLYVESLQQGRVEDPKKREQYLRHTKEDLDRLGEMVEHLLESARIASTAPEVHSEELDLAELTGRSLERLASEGVSSGATVTLEAPDAVPARADAKAVETILRNLVSNAVKYGGHPPRIEVHVWSSGARAMLRVRDFGPGLQGADHKQILEAFVRGGDEIVRTRQGVGLGLFMVSELTRAMHGETRVPDDLDGQGFAIEIALPSAAGAA